MCQCFSGSPVCPPWDTTPSILLNIIHDSWVSKKKPPLSNVSLQSIGTNDRNDADAYLQAVKKGGRGIKASQGRWMAPYRLPAHYWLSKAAGSFTYLSVQQCFVLVFFLQCIRFAPWGHPIRNENLSQAGRWFSPAGIIDLLSILQFNNLTISHILSYISSPQSSGRDFDYLWKRAVDWLVSVFNKYTWKHRRFFTECCIVSLKVHVDLERTECYFAQKNPTTQTFQ